MVDAIDWLKAALDDQAGLLEGTFDSPAEYDFAYSLLKYVERDVRAAKQVEVRIDAWTFRLDFLLTIGNVRVGVEVDGQPYHQWQRDIVRDALILTGTKVDQIVRIAARGIYYHVEDVIYFMGKLYPQLLSARGKANLEQLASAYAKAHVCRTDTMSVVVYYPLPDDDPEYFEPDEISEEDEDDEGFVHPLVKVQGNVHEGLRIARHDKADLTELAQYARTVGYSDLAKIAKSYFELPWKL
jgi:hypothetical protein